MTEQQASTRVYIRSRKTGQHFGTCATIRNMGHRVVWSSATWPVGHEANAVAECCDYAAQHGMTVVSAR